MDPCRVLEELEEVIAKRLREMPEGSYTALLARRGIGFAARKLGEEAVETIVEAVGGTPDRLAEEAADLLYHLIVVLHLRGLSLSDVARVLWERRAKRWSR